MGEQKGKMTDKQYHYRECGLEDVYLLNGFEFKSSKYGELVMIHDIDGLHREIGLYLVREKADLTGAEVRFIRHELDISQRMLGNLLHKSGQSVARWEKDQSKIDGSSDRLLRVLFENHAQPAGEQNGIRQMLEHLAELDSYASGPVQFEDTESGWQLHAA